jgi:hypothetical protein
MSSIYINRKGGKWLYKSDDCKELTNFNEPRLGGRRRQNLYFIIGTDSFMLNGER